MPSAAARERQQTPEGRALLRERVVAEHRLARLGQLRIGQARYVGRRKTRFQLLIAATLANLRRVWNWEAGVQTAEAEGRRGCLRGTAAPALTTTGKAAGGALRRAGRHFLRLACSVMCAGRAPTAARIPPARLAQGRSNATCRPRF